MWTSGHNPMGEAAKQQVGKETAAMPERQLENTNLPTNRERTLNTVSAERKDETLTCHRPPTTAELLFRQYVGGAIDHALILCSEICAQAFGTFRIAISRKHKKWMCNFEEYCPTVSLGNQTYGSQQRGLNTSVTLEIISNGVLSIFCSNVAI